MTRESFLMFALPDLAVRRAREGGAWLRFLDRDTLTCGVYHLPRGGVDDQSPHAMDEVYHVVSGRARFECDGATVAVEAGSILFVRAGVEHRFVEIESDLAVLVFFSKAAGDAAE